jgi:hypothetical protein
MKSTTIALVGCLAAASVLDAQSAPPPAPMAVVSGVIFDSLHLKPLVSANVQVDGTPAAAVTDSLGQYRIDGIPPGKHQIVVYHPLLDSLQTSLYTPPLDFTPTTNATVALAVPPQRMILARVCANDGVASIVAIGQVRDADSDEPIAGARVTAWVTRVSVGPGSNNQPVLQRAAGSLQTVTDATGGFHLCIPAVQQLQLAARLGGARTGNIGYGATNGVLFPILRVARADSALPVGGDTIEPPQRGHSTLIGKVVTAAGKPVDDATVQVVGTHHVVTTNHDGAYTLDSLPSGTQILVARHIGFPESVTTVDLGTKSAKSVTSTLATAVATLPKVDVKGRQAAIANALQRVGFTQRSKGTVGHFLNPDQIAAIGASYPTDLLRRMPGVRVIETPTGRRLAAAGASPASGGVCTLYAVDGQQVFMRGDNDDQILPRADDIIAVEEYTAGEVPIGGSPPAAGCVVFRIWTTASVLTG